MSSTTLENPLLVVRTPEVASTSSPSKRRVQREHLERRKRSANVARQQQIADMDAIVAAEQACQLFSANNVLSCYPNSSTVVYQDQWTYLVFNSRLPQYQPSNLVNIYLFHGESQTQINSWLNVQSPNGRAGTFPALINDSWWGSQGSAWNGQNRSYLFYWVITPNGGPLGNSYTPQATFTAVQTTYASSVLATLSPSSSRSPSSSITSPSGSSSLSNGSPQSSSSVTPGRVQSDGSPAFPHWAIAVIVVLGFLTILASCVIAFVIVPRVRRRRGADLSHRSSIGSSVPMMAETHAHDGASPLLGAATVGVAPGELPSSVDHHDAASVISRTNSAGDSALFSGADAAIMADAFRKALRKPDFADGAVEEESPEEKQRKEAELLNRELAEEGRDIRNVSSSRGVRVETLNSDGATVRDNTP